MSDPDNLIFVVRAQRGDCEQTWCGIEVGRRESHRMWLVFPQIAGLGRQLTAR